MKNIVKKSIVFVTIFIMTLTLAIPMQTYAARKVKLNKTKADLTMTDKRVKPTVQLKINGTSRKATWTSSNKAVAIVSKTGKVTAKKKGSAKITVKVSGRKYTCRVTVADKRTRLNKTSVSLTMTDKKRSPAVQLKVTGTSKKVAWATSNKKVATVSKNGKVTAKKKGTAVVSAKVNNRTYKCKVIVKDIHKHDYFKSQWHNPQCFLDGEVIYSCRICNDEYTEVLPALEHSFVKVSQGTESFTGKTIIKYQCTKCQIWYTQYPGPLIDYKKPHIHCNCGMDFNSIDGEDGYTMHAFYGAVAGVGNHGNHNYYCCLV